MAFVGLVGLYACNVRRLRTEKRNAANFLDCFALAFSWIASLLLLLFVVCLVVASLLFFVLVVFSLLGWVVGGSFSLRTV